ncbi:MAG: hypothetical protein H6Q52_2952, partial [Deltaproteobacteria bacterium]|nr:hypothetical protein [Deltaproteobacteria bacterium]
MDRVMNRIKMHRVCIFVCIAVMLAVFMTGTEGLAASKNVTQKTFSSAEKASQALLNAAKTKDVKEMYALFGTTEKNAIISRDEAVNNDLFERFIKAYEEKNRLDMSPNNDKALLYVGNNEWSFPAPIVKKGNKWFFDTKQGRAEILHRRIGRNELDTIESCRAYVDAQKDYARMTGPKDSPAEFAQKFVSDPGTRNGLYWETKEGEEPSPLGVFMARARKEGLQSKKGGKPVPYHGYYYRILTSQGKDALGGVRNYVVNGKMTQGYGLVAYP